MPPEAIVKAFAEAIRVLPAHMSSRFSEVDANEPQLQLVFRHDCLCAPSTLLQLSCCVCCALMALVLLVRNWSLGALLMVWRTSGRRAGGPGSALLAALVQCALVCTVPSHYTVSRLHSCSV